MKIVWTLRTDAIGANASMFRTETRAAATDATARALMTAYGAPEIVAAAFDLGVVRVVAKPFELRDMTDLVAEAGAAVHPS